MITKTETREIFDRSKIGVGDIIEMTKFGGGIFGTKPEYRHWAIVSQVDPEYIYVCARRGSGIDDEYILSVKRAEDIRVIFRHPANL